MELATPYILFFCGIGIVGSFIIGVMLGWFGNDIIYAFLNKTRIVPMHPEMFDEHGNVLPDEIVAFRFENSDDFDDEQDED